MHNKRRTVDNIIKNIQTNNYDKEKGKQQHAGRFQASQASIIPRAIQAVRHWVQEVLASIGGDQ